LEFFLRERREKMSAFAKIFGFKKDEKAITSGEAIQKLRETEEMLMKKQDFLEKKDWPGAGHCEEEWDKEQKSRPLRPEEEEEVRETASADRRNLVHDRDAEGGLGKCKHKHGRP